jgi:hypothetical protein
MKEQAHLKSSDKKMFLIIFTVALLATLVFVFWPKETASQQLSSRAAFTECLTSKGLTMYGQDTCLNCQLQKGMFEEDFKRIHYINCDIHQDECTQKDIQGYPTWMYNGRSVLGVQNFKKLSDLTGCAAP